MSTSVECVSLPTVSILPVPILIADGEDESRAVLQAQLARCGREIVAVSCVADALAMLRKHDFALVLADVQLADMDGVGLAQHMQQEPGAAAVPLIFLTSSLPDAELSLRSYRSGAVDLLSKPVDGLILEAKAKVFIELHQQRQRLAARGDELAQALRMNEIFAAVLSHDLRNPLTAVATGAELLLRKQDSQSVVHTAERIRASGQRMATMVERLLGAARLRAGTLKARIEDVDLGVIAHRIIDEFCLPQQAGRVVVLRTGALGMAGDTVALGQMLSNLIGNALEHGEKGCEVIVDIDGTATDAIRLAVRNRGCLPEGFGASLFEPYVRGSSGHGAGLGLYIVSQLAALHGGKVQLHSDAELGTRITVDLPRQGAAACQNRPTLV